MKSFFITTAIDYTNAAPHIGHAYEKILADVIARYHRLKGESAFFLTGVDQHGQKVQQAAQLQGVAPQHFVDSITEKFRALWKKLGIEYTEWAATTDPRHKECVRRILTRLNDEGQIYKDKRGGYYSVRQEQFLTDKDRDANGEFGPEWGQVEFREEENYYFRLAEHKQWLLELIDSRIIEGRPLVVPDFRNAELRNAVEKLEGDLCISRPKARLAWGIEFPFDTEFVTYVWFDALVNYISFAPGYDPAPEADPAQFHRWWPATHVIGKDILIPAHGVYWPIMLKALGFPDDKIPPLLVHGWWNISGAKMSKSLGNIVDPNALADEYGAEALRYYLMSDIATGRDSDFSEERLIQRYNTDLANNLGNLLNRTLTMAWKYRNGKIATSSYDDEMTANIRAMGEKQLTKEAFPHCMDQFEIDTALALIRGYCGLCNELVEKSAPWKLAKAPEQADRLSAVLYHLAEALRIIATLLSPVLPHAAAGILAQLNWQRPFALANATWGGLPDGHLLGKPTPVFPRIEALEKRG
ncbi:MAG TPA: methionine--tRNA ligase [Terrimicrobiaceae bacterium]